MRSLTGRAAAGQDKCEPVQHRFSHELFYDYRLEVEGRRTKKLEREFGCDCGTRRCRGTMLEQV